MGFSMGLRMLGAASVFNHHRADHLLAKAGAAMGADHEYRDVDGAQSPGARDSLAVPYENGVGLDHVIRKFRQKFFAVIPVNAATIAFHETCARQRETASTDSYQREPIRICASQIFDQTTVQRSIGVNQTPDNDQIIEILRVLDRLPRCHLHPTARSDWRSIKSDDGPTAMNRPTAVSLISGYSKCIDERGKC